MRGEPKVDLAGRRFGRLTVIAVSDERRRGRLMWDCLCDCGATKQVETHLLRSGQTRSCGCLRRDVNNARFTTHGRSGSPEYRMLSHAKERASAQGVPFMITLEDISVPSRCPALGIPLSIGDGRIHAGSPSLDRLRPDLGYVPGNVVVISDLANRIKQKGTSVEVRAVGEWMKSLGL